MKNKVENIDLLNFKHNNEHGLPTFFIDPEYRSSFLSNKSTKYIDNIRIDNYSSLNLLINEIIDKKS